MKRPVVIGTLKFDSVLAATRHTQRFLKETFTIGPTEFDFLFSLLSRHPDATSKLKNVTSFEIVFGHSIYVHYSDGRPKEDISWRMCISNLGKTTDRVHITNSARYAVRDQISEFRKSSKSVHCAICSGSIEDLSQVHVDHMYPGFSDIWDKYAATLEAEPETIEMDGFWTRKFVSDKVSASFAEFHKTCANLRITHAACNLKAGKP